MLKRFLLLSVSVMTLAASLPSAYAESPCAKLKGDAYHKCCVETRACNKPK
jgi:hypothetical protein